jgi:hypothetical protein
MPIELALMTKLVMPGTSSAKTRFAHPATQLVGEPITANLVVGLGAVLAGIWIATTEVKEA